QSLMQFVSRLSKVCKGVDRVLDNRLAALRTALKKNPDIGNITPLINDISGLLIQQESRNATNIKSTKSSIATAGKELQRQKGLPDQLRRDLRGLLAHVDDTPTSMHEFLPILDQLVALYQQAFSAKNSAKSSSGPDASDDDTDDDLLSHKISLQLINLISELAFEGDHAKKIDAIRNSLINNGSISHLVDASLGVIKLIISSMSEERVSAQHFLLSINDALSGVHNAVVTSLDKSRKISEEMSKLDDIISRQIKDLSVKAVSATSLDELQSLVSIKLLAINEAIQNKERLERDEKEALLDSLGVMESRLGDGEKEAEQYKKHLAEQKFKSLQDALTKLPNRAAFDERLDIEFNRWNRYGYQLCLAVVDIDFFKRINDSYGHSAGDKTLKVIATALKKSLRTTDFIARFGGEEFVILMPETKLGDMEVPLNKIRSIIKKIPFKFKGKDVTITISIGVTEFKEKDNSLQAFDRADAALYEAKNSGRDKVILRS
ncbi:MAG: GGDEF domain-containing protein, partial [Psychrosphaera sp.]|nr:GGDEF domain-containing protein [Psychrosphaera sp.]